MDANQQDPEVSAPSVQMQDAAAAATDPSNTMDSSMMMMSQDLNGHSPGLGDAGASDSQPQGSDAFEYLSFGGTFRRTVGLFMDHYDLFGILSAVSLVPYGMCYSTLTLFTLAVQLEQRENPDFHPSHLPLLTLVVLLEAGLYAVFTLAGRAAMFRAVAQLYVRSSSPSSAAGVPGAASNQGIISWQRCFRDAFQKNLVTLMGAALITIFAMLGIALIPYFTGVWVLMSPNLFTVILFTICASAGLAYGTYVYIGWILSGPAIVLEQQGHRQATLRNCNCEGAKRGLRRSWELTTDSRCYVMCSLFILYMVHTIVRRLMHTLFTNSGTVNDVLFTIPGILAEFLPKFIFFPLHSILEAVLYLNLRIGREALSRDMLEAEIQHGLDDLNNTSENAANGTGGWMTSSVLDEFSSQGEGAGAATGGNSNGGLGMFSFRQNVSTDYRQVPLMDGEQQQQLGNTSGRPSDDGMFSPPTLPESEAPQQTYI
mmetsp:Transcript_327/g.745  ORF Transcript_327/g.745 Transcript_327/m.745 type:complete len:485 (+) Transcript_327:305-1759(+)